MAMKPPRFLDDELEGDDGKQDYCMTLEIHSQWNARLTII